MKKFAIFFTILMVLAILLAGCRSKSPASSGSKDSATVLTEAAVTADALMRTMAASSPTPKPVTPTPKPSDTPEIVTSPTALPGVPTQPGGGPAPAVGESAGFVSDVTVPDGTVFAPNANFLKTWRLKNTGTTTWTPSYTVVFSNGDDLKPPASIALPATVPPGQTVDISVPMIAPLKEGSYTANFLIANDKGQRFGLPPNNTQPFYVVIVVSRTDGTPAATATPATPTVGPSVTPGTGGNIVSWVFLSVDNAAANTCPHTYNFTGQVTLKNPTTLTYRLEFLSNTPGTAVPVLDPVTVPLPPGQHVLNFQVNFTSNFNGVARLHVTAPEDIYSNPVNLVLTCPAVTYPTP